MGYLLLGACISEVRSKWAGLIVRSLSVLLLQVFDCLLATCLSVSSQLLSRRSVAPVRVTPLHHVLNMTNEYVKINNNKYIIY